MGPTLVATPTKMSFVDDDKRTLKQIESSLTMELKTHKRWTSNCTSLIQSNLKCLFQFDRFEYSVSMAYGPDVDYKIVLNPCMILCYHPKCVRNARPPIKLRHMFQLQEYLLHIEEHVDEIGQSMQLRFGAVSKNIFATKEELDDLGPSPSLINNLMESVSENVLSSLYQCIDAYGIERLLVRYSEADMVQLGDHQERNTVLPKNPHYLCHWKDLLIYNGIINSASLPYQEDDAFIFTVLQYPDPVRNWTVWGTVYLYSLKLLTSVSATCLNLYRGVTHNRLVRRNRPSPDIVEFAKNVNHAAPSISVCQLSLPHLKYENKTYHTSEIMFHIKCCEKSKNSFKFDFSNKVTRYPVCAGIDEQEINQGTFVVNGELCGLVRKMTALDIKEIGLKNLASYISKENNFVIAVREYRLSDFSGIFNSNVVTSFESKTLTGTECLEDLIDVAKFANSCLNCLSKSLTCEYKQLDDLCNNCAQLDERCVSLVLFHVLWDMGSGHKKAAKNSTYGLEIDSTEYEMMNSMKFTIAFGGLHLGKAFVNNSRNHVLQFRGEFFGTDILIAIKDENIILQCIKNAVFVGKDRQSDLLAFMTVCRTVQEALKAQKEYWLQRIPEKYLSYKEKASSQKKIIYAVDVCSNKNGDIFVLDSGAACIHVVDRSTVAAVFIIGKYNVADEESHTNRDIPKNTTTHLKFSNSLLDLSIDDDDNLYVSDIEKNEVIVINNCDRAKKCHDRANFFVIQVENLLSSVFTDNLFVLAEDEGQRVVSLVSFCLPKTKNSKNFILSYELKVKIKCDVKQLFAVPFNKCFGGIDNRNTLKIFYYSNRGKVKSEIQLNVTSDIKPYISQNGAIITSSVSGIDVHQYILDGKGTIEFRRSHDLEGVTKAIYMRRSVMTVVVNNQNVNCVLQHGPLDFAIEFTSAICKLYEAIGYVPPNEKNKTRPKITLEESVKKGKVAANLLGRMQLDAKERSPGRTSFDGRDGMPATATINCLESTVKSWEVLEERVERIEKGSSKRIFTPAITNEKDTEHSFGFIKMKGQGHNQNMQEYIVSKRRHVIDFQMKMCDMPFCQHTKEKIQDKGYQDTESNSLPITPEDLKEIFAHSEKEHTVEIIPEVSTDDEHLVKKAYLLSKCVPRQSNRAKWREKSGHQPNMLPESQVSGMLQKGDLVFSMSETEELVFFIVQENYPLIDKSQKVVVKKPSMSNNLLISCEKLIGENGMIFTVPPQLYTVVESDVSINEIVQDSLDLISSRTECSLTDEDWALLMEDEEEDVNSNVSNNVNKKNSNNDNDSNNNDDDNNTENNENKSHSSGSKRGKRKLGSGDSRETKRSLTENDIKVDMLVTVLYEGEEYPGKVTEITNNGLYQVSCMEKGGSSGSSWRWPMKKDETTYHEADIPKRNITLHVLPGTERNIEFHVPALDDKWGKPLTKTF